mmetsp:Transcript_35723/g.54670  ORF Transcript_35723/g.54670 Transcript_35723/m.54670 type:complete len:254 (-) Transcript_35723:18-779(-)
MIERASVLHLDLALVLLVDLLLGEVDLHFVFQVRVDLDQDEVVHRLALDDGLQQLDQNNLLVPINLLEQEHLEDVLVHDLVRMGAAVDLAVVLVQVECVLSSWYNQWQVLELTDHLARLLSEAGVFNDFVAQNFGSSDFFFRFFTILLALLIGFFLLLRSVGQEESQLAEEIPAPIQDLVKIFRQKRTFSCLPLGLLLELERDLVVLAGIGDSDILVVEAELLLLPLGVLSDLQLVVLHVVVAPVPPGYRLGL